MVLYSDGRNHFDSSGNELYTLIKGHILGKKIDIGSIIRDSKASFSGAIWEEESKPTFLKDAEKRLEEIKKENLFALLEETNTESTYSAIDYSAIKDNRVLGMEVDGIKVKDFTLQDLWSPEKKNVVVGDTTPSDSGVENKYFSLGDYTGDIKGFDDKAVEFGDKEAGETIRTKVLAGLNKLLEEVTEDVESTVAGTRKLHSEGIRMDGFRINHEMESEGEGQMLVNATISGKTKVKYPENFSQAKRVALQKKFTNVSFIQDPQSERGVLFGQDGEIIGGKRFAMPKTGTKDDYYEGEGGKVVQSASKTGSPDVEINIAIKDIVDENITKDSTGEVDGKKETIKGKNIEEFYALSEDKQVIEVNANRRPPHVVDKKKFLGELKKELTDIIKSEFIIGRIEDFHRHPLEVVSFELTITTKDEKIITGPAIIEAYYKGIKADKEKKVNIEYVAKLRYFKHGVFGINPSRTIRQTDKRKQYGFQNNLDSELSKMMRRTNSIGKMLRSA